MRRLDGVYSLGVVLSSKPVRRVGLLLTLLAVVIGITGSGFLPTLTQSQTGSASGARLWSSGAELNSLTADMEITSSSGTTPTIDSTTKRSGGYAYRANTSSNTATIYKTWANSAQQNKFWFRAYIRIATAPGTEIGIFRAGTSTNNKIGVRMNSDRSIELWNEEDNAIIGSASSVLATNTWYRIELYIDTTTLSSAVADMELRLDGVQVASSTDRTLDAGVDRLTWGVLTSTTADLYFDDIAVNDSTGRTDNWPGEGKIVHMQPDATGDNEQWDNTTEAGSPTECDAAGDPNWQCVDEIPPDNSTTYSATTTNNEIDDYNIESSTSAGLTANDYVRLVSVGVRFRACGTTTEGFGCAAGESNQDLVVRLKAAASGTTDEATTTVLDSDTTWRTNDDDSAQLNKITDYDLPGTSTSPWTTTDLDSSQIGVKTNTNNGVGIRASAIWLQVEYVPNFGGRLFSSGFELNSTVADEEWTATTSSPAINSSTFRSGAYALETENAGGAEWIRYNFATSNTTGDYFVRAYLRIATGFDSSDVTVLSILNTTNSRKAYIKLTASETLTLHDEDGAIGSASSTLSTGVWYRVELKLVCGTACDDGNDEVDGRLDGVSFASSTTRDITAGGAARLGLGLHASDDAESTTNTVGDLIWDDVALNKNQGSYQNTWPGAGKIIHLRPNATGDNSETWASAGSETTTCDDAADANWQCLDEITPDEATSYVEETTTGDYEDFNLDASPIGASDTVNVVHVGARFRTSSATQEDFKVRIKDNTSAVPIESDTLSPASTTWVSNRTAAPYQYPLTAYTRPEQETAWTDTQLDTAQIGVRDIAGSGTVQVSTLWLLVDYTPPEITISGSCDQYDQTTDCTDDGSNEIAVAVNGTIQTGKVDATVDGAWAISGVTQPVINDIVTVFINGEATDDEEAVAVTKYDGTGDITGIQLFWRHLSIGSVDNQTLSNTDLSQYDNSVSADEDIFFDVSAGDDLTVDSLGSYTDEELYIAAGDTFRPASGGGADVTTMHVENDGTWTADGNVVTVNGNWQNDSVFSSGTSTVTFNTSVTGRTLSGTLSGVNGKFYNIDFTTAEGTATDDWEIQAAVEAANDFTLSAGNIDTNNNAVTVTRDLTLTNALNTDFAAGSSTITVSRHFNDTGDKYTHSTDTLVMAGTGTFTVANNSQFYNVHLGPSGFTTTLSLNDWDVNNVLTFNGGTVAGGGGSWIDLHCSGTCTPVVFASATTLNSSRDLIFRTNSASSVLTITGANYGSWGIVNYAATGNGSTFQLGGNITTTSFGPRLEATNGITGSIFTTTASNYSITSSSMRIAPCTPARTGSWTASLNDSVIALSSTSDALYVGTDCGSHTLNLNTSDVTVSGNVKFVNGTGTITVDPGTSDFRFTPPTAAVKTYSPNGQALYNVYINGATSTADVQPDAAAQINNDLTMTNGRLVGTQNITVNGHVQGTAGEINLTSGTFTQRVSANKNFGTTSGSTAWTFSSLTFSNSHASAGITVTTQTGGTGGITVTTLLKIGSSGDAAGATTTLDAGNRTWTLSGNATTGIPFEILASPAGVLTANVSTFTYTGNIGLGNMTVQAATYYNLDINRNGEIFVLEGTTNAGNDLTITNGTLDTTASNHGMSITRDVLIANTAGATFRARGSTITVSRDWSKGLNGTFTRDSSTVQLNGDGQILTVGGGQTQFENLTVAYNTKTTTMATARTDVFGVLTIGDASGGTMTCSVTCEFELFRTAGADLVIGTGATLSGSNATFQLRKQSAATVTVTGATNYGTWNILMRANVSAGGLVTYNVGGNITTNGYIQVKADTLSTATFNTQNFTINADKWIQGDSTDNSATTSNWGSSTATFDLASAADTFYVSSNGGAQVANFQTASISATGHVKFVNGTGTLAVDDGTSTFTFAPTTGTSTYSPNGQTLYNVIVNGAATVQPDAAVVVANDLTMTAGTLNGTQNITVNGNVAGTAGIISLTGGTFEQRLLANVGKNFGTTSGSTAWTFNDLTFSSAAVFDTWQTITTQTGGSGGITVSAVMRVNRAAGANDNDGIILTGGNRTWTLSGASGIPLRMETTDFGGFIGQINPGTSTFTFTGDYPLGNTTVEQNPNGSSTGYYNLDINNSSETYVLEGNTTVGNDLTVTNGALSTTGSNHSLTVTRDLTLANTAGVGLTGNGSTITVSRNWTDLGGKFTPGTSTVTLNGTGAIDLSTGFEFYNLNLAYSTFTTTLPASKTINVESVVTLNGGTLSGSSSVLTPRPRVSSKPLVVNSTTAFTGSGFNIISWTGYNASLTLTVDGDNYSHSSWNLFFAGTTNDTTFQLDAGLTTSTEVRVYAGGVITGTAFNTANNAMTLSGFRLGSGGATQTVSANFGSSTISFTGTGNTLYPESTGGTYNLDLGTSSITTTGDVRFINTSGTITVTEGTSTVTFTPAASATRTYAPNAQSLYHVIINGGNDAAEVDLTGNADFNGNLTVSGGRLDTITGSEYSIDAFDVTQSGTAAIKANAATITVRGNWVSNATWNSNIGTSTVVFTGVSKSIDTSGSGGSTRHFYKLTINSGASINLAGTELVNTDSDVNVQGTFNITSACGNGVFYYGGTGTTLTVGASGVLGGSGGCFTLMTATPTYSFAGSITTSNFRFQITTSTTIPAYTYGGNLYFRPTSGSPTYTIGAGTMTLTSSWTNENTGAGTLTVDNTVNNTNFTAGNAFNALSSSGSYSFLMGSATYDINGAWNDADSASFTNGTSTVLLSGTGTQTVSRASGANTFYNLQITNSSGASASDCERTGFTASVDFANDVTVTNNLTFTTANTRVEFDDANTYTFNNINWNGQAGGTRVYFRNSAVSGSWNLNVSGTQTAVSYVNVSRSNASSGNTIGASNGTNIDCGNNVNWSFANPSSPTNLAQKKTDDTVITTGGWTNELSVKFTADISDGDNPATIQLCVERDILGVLFSNTEDSCGATVAYSGTPVAASVTISVTDTNEYHWQARVKDSGGAYSGWVSYGGNGEGERDFGVDTTACTYGGLVYDGTVEDVDADFNDGSVSALSSNWDAFTCTVSGLNKYQYSIGTTVGGTDIKGWTDNSTTESVTASSLNLHTNQRYYFNVRAVDNANNTSSPTSSNGQDVLPTLTFTLGSTTLTFNNLNDSNNRQDGETLTITTSTNAYGGYVVRQYATGLLTNGTFTIPMFQGGTYASPGAWPAGFCTGGSTCGYGYTSNDSTIQGADKFNGGLLYAALSMTAFGDIIADHTDAVTGGTGAVVNEQYTITHRVAVDALQEAKTYQTEVLYIVTGTF
ncbi:MAG: hypothetical protein HZB70_04075 [Candidatus Berkelbacteria bacterium]|nr:MAG: hypothetical protein HZB70_04075 [Candidatus Berkelbacteria bacterium]QQG51522.1 MAG: hypothetical protein HY845_03115 [Candidatus Berkelbacteria bacterium]